MKLTPRLALTFVIYAAALLAGVGLLAYYNGRAALRSATISELSASAIEKQAALNEWIENKQLAIALVATDPSTIESAAALMTAIPDSPEARSAYDGLLKEIVPWTRNKEFLSVMLIHPESGEVLAATDPSEEGKFKEDRPYFINGKLGPYVQNVYYALALQGPAMTASAPLIGPDGQLLGVLAGRLNLGELNNIINRRSGLRQTDEAFLVNTSNLFVTQPRFISDPAVLQRGVHTEVVRRCLRQASGEVDQQDYRDVPTIVVYRWLPEAELCLITKLDQTEAYGPARAFGGAVVAISALALLVATVLAVGLARSLTRPILALQAGAARWGGGSLETKLPVNSHDELGELAHQFNKMAASLLEKDAELRAHAQMLEQKVQERTRELQESHSQLSRAEQIGQIGSWEWNIPENRMMWSEGLYKVFGLSPQEFGATHEAYLERVHPDDLENVREAVDHAFAAGGTFEFESRFLRKDGTYRYLYTRGEMLLAEHGKAAHMIGISIDITERIQAEALLRESEDKFKYLFDHSIIGKSITLPDGELNVNKAFCEMVGYSEEELKSRKWQEITHPDDIELSTQAIAVLVRGEKDSVRFIKRYIHKNGSAVWADVSTVVRRDEAGKPVYFMTALMDITERIQAEQAIQRITDDLLRSNAELEQFAYVASHDLQEPLRMISSYVQLLAKRYQGKLDSNADEFIAFAVEGATRMQNLINDLLAYSRVGMHGNPFMPVSSGYLLEEALADLQLTIQESGAKVTHDSLPVVKGDPIQLVQLFQNLVGNAIKFRGAEPPCVHISARQEDSEWIFSVHDNGIGFDPKFAERIFAIFQRLNDRATYPGTGIGLAVCKRIIQRHGGRIWVESEPGKGSTFYFSLPANGS